MSTRSIIGIIPNKALPTFKKSSVGVPITPITTIYCHWDGYPSNNGKLLLENWMSAKKVRALMALGDLSSLGSIIGEKHSFDNHGGYNYDKKTGKSWQDENCGANKGWCCAYGRDRGETDVYSKDFMTLNALFANIGWADYVYLYDVKHHKWFYTEIYGDKAMTLKPLTMKVCEKK